MPARVNIIQPRAGIRRPPGFNLAMPPESGPPLSFDDPRFAEVTPGTPGQSLAIGASLTDKEFAAANNGNAIVVMLGSNALSRVRIGLPTREGPRIAGGGTFTLTDCWIECDGSVAADDHADCVQAFSPGDVGTLELISTTIRAHVGGDTGPDGAGAVGVFLADNWTGTLRCRDVLFWSGMYGCRAFPDVGGDMHLDFENVYFAGPFGFGPFSLGDAVGGHVTIVDHWVNVCEATIVGGAIVPGAPFDPPA